MMCENCINESECFKHTRIEVKSCVFFKKKKNSISFWAIFLFSVLLVLLVACDNQTELSIEQIKKCKYDTSFYDYFSQEETSGKTHHMEYYTVNLDRYNCGEKGTYTLKSISHRENPYNNKLGMVIDVELTRAEILEKLREKQFDSLREVAYDSMIKKQSTNSGYYMFMKNTFKGSAMPINIDTQWRQ